MNKFKILAVDDEPAILKIIKEQLSDHDIVIEQSSQRALEIIQEKQFDIFIIDYQMPQVNGIQLLEEIQRVYSGRQYVGILCTSYGTIHLFKSELIKGLYQFYIEKPFEIDVIKQTVARAIVSLQRMQPNEN